MVSQSKSKAQRRAEAQQRAAERRAAERRAKQMKMGLRVGGVVLAVGLVAIIIVVATGGSTPSATASGKSAHVATVAIPASMKGSWIQPPAAPLGPEQIPIPKGTSLANLANAATGETKNGIQCQTNEQLVSHNHTHLTIFVNGKAKVVPYGIGIPGEQAQATPSGAFVSTGSCFYWLHAHANDGIIHIESPSNALTFHLGQFFAEWGIPLSSTQVGPAKGKVTVFFNGKLYLGNPANLPLGHHYEIQLDVGTPIVAPVKLSSFAQL